MTPATLDWYVALHFLLAVAATTGFMAVQPAWPTEKLVLLATVIAAQMGTEEVAAMQIGLEIWSLLALALDAIAIAGQALVAQELGAGRTATAHEASRRMVGMSIQVGVVFALAVMATLSWSPHIFTDDPEVVRLAGFGLVFVAIMQPLNGVVFALDGVLIGAGDLAFLARAMVGAFLTFASLAAAVHATGAGVGWLWAAVMGLMVARAIPLWARFRTDRWMITGAAAT